MADIKINNLVRFFVLVELSEAPAHGYTLIKQTGKRLGKNISASEIYPFLQELKTKKFVWKGKHGARDKTVYHLTAEGKKLVESLIEKFDSIADALIQKKVAKCAHCNCEIYKGGHKEKIGGKTRIFCCCHCAHAYKK